MVETLDLIRVEQQIPPYPAHFHVPGRPPKDRAAIARAFVAKAVYDMPTTRMLLDRLQTDAPLRRICGWERKREVPSESVFSRAFDAFAQTQLPERVHETLIRKAYQDRLIGHLSRDATAIEAREQPRSPKPKPPDTERPKGPRGRPRKGEERPKEPTRLQRQGTSRSARLIDSRKRGW